MNARFLRVIVFVWLAACGVVKATTFTVTSAADSGAGSLREAITLANASSGNVIAFNITGSGVQTITLAAALPEITNVMTIDGTTQPGYASSPLIVIDGNSGNFDGLAVNYRGSFQPGPVIKGLGIVHFGGDGIHLVSGDAITVTACYIGINAAGTAAAGNAGAGIRISSGAGGGPITLIGGTTAADRNVISGNTVAGVSVEFNFITVTGNYIGTSADGMSAVPNGDGVIIQTNTAAAVKIGTNTAGAGNVISGNSGHGIHVLKNSSTVQGNIIGLAADGATALGNTGHGIFMDGATATIGSTTAGAGNTISSNGGDGVRFNVSNNGVTISGNRIGTDTTGMIARGNTGLGVNVVASSATATNTVGSNQISANGTGGVRIASGKLSVTGNLIGVNADSTAKLGNHGDGVAVTNVVSSPGTQNDFGTNTIGGNTGAGISIAGSSNDLFVKNNLIGTNSSGANLGNTGPGIRISTATNTTINNHNTIAFNGGDGIEMDSQTNISINSIHDNGDLAVDRLPNGVNPPTPHGLLNLPMISDVTTSATDITYTFKHDAAVSTGYRGYFFRNDAPNSSGHGEMQTYLGTITWTTNGSGHFEGTATFPIPSGAAAEAPAEQTPTANVYTLLLCTNPGGSFVVVTTGEVAEFLKGGGVVVKQYDSNGNVVYSANTNEPINTFTGELFDLESVDLNLGGPMPLFFSRYYASKIESDGQITSALGRNRLHNFDAKLKIEADKIIAAMSDGRAMQFDKANGRWVLAGPLDIAFQLVQSGASYILADPRSQRMWTFDGNGVLQMIEDGRGNMHTLTYTGANLTNVSDGLGRTLTFSYDGSNHLTGVSDGARAIAFTYSGSDLTTASDALSHVTTYTYDGSGHLLSWQRPLGNSPYSQIYTSDRVTSQTEHPGGPTNMTALAYDTNTHATTITDPTSKTRVHTHSEAGQLTRFTDEEAKSVEITYDASQRRNSVTDRLGRKTLITYHLPSGKPASVVAPDGATTTFAYKQRVLNGVAFYDLVKATFADGTSRSFTYDAKGNLLTAIDQLGKKTTFTYDTHGRVLTATNPTGGVMTFTYDAKENLMTSKDSGTGETLYAYDAFSRLTTLTHPAIAPDPATHVDIVYDDADRITSITDERGNAFGYTYDVNDNVTVITDPAGKPTTLGYDELDRMTQMTDRLGKVSSRAFDSRDWVESVTDENNHSTTIAHDTRQRTSGITDPGNATWALGYNDEAEMTSITDPLGHALSFVRNKRGNIVAASDALGHTVGVERDSLQRITKVVDPVGRAMSLSYDKHSMLVASSRDGLGTAKYIRDAAGRIAKVTDLIGGAWSYAYTPEGHIAAMTDPLGRMTTQSYDTRGRLSGVTFADGVTETITRDGASNVTRRLYSDGTDLTYSYDNLDRLTSAGSISFAYDFEDRLTLTDYGSGNSFGATYDDAGRMMTVSYDNGAFTVTYGYDSRDRLTSVSDSLNNLIVRLTYDAAGRLTTITRGNVTTTHTYDAGDRLTRIQHANGGTIADLRYTLNADGDITALDATAPLLPAVQASAQPFKFDKASQLVGTDFAYDARGRLVKSGAETFEWDGASRLKKHGAVTLAYDALGGIASRTENATTTTFFLNYAWELPSIAEEKSGASVRRYVRTPDGMLLYSIDETNTYSFYLFDHLGSTIALTNAAGAVTDSYAYSPQGEDLGHGGTPGTSTQPFRYVGAWDIRAEGALYQMRARYYAPTTARFLSTDPAGPQLADVRTLDPYLYALGNPTRYIDVTGAVPTSPQKPYHPDPYKNQPYDALNWWIGSIVAGGITADGKPKPQPPPPRPDPEAEARWKAQQADPYHGYNPNAAMDRAYKERQAKEAAEKAAAEQQAVIDEMLKSVPAAKEAVATALAVSGGNQNPVLERTLLGFEKTFLDGNASVGVRVPAASSDNAGDLSNITKYALVNERATGNVLSRGLSVTAPTDAGANAKHTKKQEQFTKYFNQSTATHVSSAPLNRPQ